MYNFSKEQTTLNTDKLPLKTRESSLSPMKVSTEQRVKIIYNLNY